MFDKTVNFTEPTTDTDFFFDKNTFHVRNSKFKWQNANAKGMPKVRIERLRRGEWFCLTFEL
jgi:hypothetical protein